MKKNYDLKTKRLNLLNRLKENGYIRTEKVFNAMNNVPREKFVPYISKRSAYDDRPLQIKGNQTISAPHMVAEMCETADFHPDHKVLEIGAGSGYNAAVIGKLVPKGIVYTTDVVPSLVEEARKNLTEAGIENAVVVEQDGSMGLSKHANYDRIVVTCASPGIPKPLKKQLRSDGKLIIPVGNHTFQSLMIIQRKKNNKFFTEEKMGCVFVPMKGKYGFP